LRVEFVAQVVQRIELAVRMGAEGGPGGGQQVVKVGECAGQPGADPTDLGAQERDRVERPGERAQG
jgi:hypothetical protein